MKERYRYSRLRALYLYGPFIALPIMGLMFAPEKSSLYLDYLFFYLSLFIVPFLLLVNKFSVRISLDDTGIVYKSLFKNLHLKWRDIEGIRLKYFADFGLMRGGEYLEIRSTSKKRIKVVNFIMNCGTMDSYEGLGEFEATVRKYTQANRPALMLTDSVSTDSSLSPVPVSDEHGDEETTTENRRQNIIFQMVLLPIVCLVLVHYFTKDIQETAELVGCATLLFLPVMLVIRKMLILESQGKLTRRASVLTAVVGSAFLVLIHLLFRRKDYANVSVLFVFTVEVIMYLSYIYLKKGALPFSSHGKPPDEYSTEPTKTTK